ncbi:hypothetical protein DS6A_24 [Mycobacterium phage DS6A]|uniref:Uncharacterized protein n=1 Tax=Mycobacterium phage DS6A TaxID=45764 RepID=G8I4D4_9CAUD|nr:hypothetical protein DS6A_24 [Mycobacterium phage DS6A]AER47578.1 hypothetical protein DS6A_24 [Mycobacterium phage DS6A]
MTATRKTAVMTGHRMDNLGGEPELVEVYVDNGEWVNPPAPAAPVDPADEPIMLTRAELTDVIAEAVAAAVVAQQETGSTPAAVKRAAREAAAGPALGGAK